LPPTLLLALLLSLLRHLAHVLGTHRLLLLPRPHMLCDAWRTAILGAGSRRD
jgi:hypothetical protein